MTTILDGKKLAQKVRIDLKNDVEQLKLKGVFPKLAVIMVGDDSSSKIYIKNKSRACEEVGIEYEEFILDASTTMDELLELITNLNMRKDIHGILLQSPIPKNLDINLAFQTILPEKDVDGFNPYNVGKLCLGQETFVSCTPFGVMKILNEYGIEIEGKNAVILGRSNIVGKPMAQCLLNKNATVTVCHSKTKNIKEIAKSADILVCAIGKPKFVTKEMVKKGSTVIDVGISRDEIGKICGDVDFDNVKDIVEYITPVPGGVGPMTIAMLMTNIIKAAKR